MIVEAVTADLITDDPRREVEDSPFQEAKRFMAFIKRGGGLTQSQLAKVCDVTPGTISSALSRGRLKFETYFDQKWIPREECASYIVMNGSGERMAGGRGWKAPSISEMWKATWDDLDS